MTPIKHVQLISNFFRQNWPVFFFGIIVLIIVDFLQVTIPKLIGQAVDEFGANSGGLHTKLLQLVVISLCIALLRYVYRNCIMGTTRRLEYYLREKLFAHALRLPMTYYDHSGPGKVMALTTSDVAAVRIAVGFGTMLFIDAVIMGAVSFVIMGYTIDWGLTIWSTLPLPITLLGATHLGKTVHESFRNVQEKFSTLTEFSQEIFSGAKVIKGFAAEKRIIERFTAVNDANVSANLVMARVQAGYIPLTHTAPLLCYAIALFIGGQRMMSGELTVGEFTAFIGYLGLIIWPVMGLGFLINTVQRGTASLIRIGEMLELQPYETSDVEKATPLANHSIIVKDLSFAYPAAVVDSLTKVNLSIPAGKVIGVVGRTGAGKSTLLKLLIRLYDPPEDAIYIGGREIHSIDFGSLRQSIGYVPQDTMLFSQTIGQNIAFDKEYSRKKIEVAAQLAAVKEAIDERPYGFDALLGERGKKLSGGQQQRVAVARAIVKEPPILLLDDVFAALDYHTQAELLQNMRQFIAGKTVIIVSQRVAAVKDADIIVVMDKGVIVEQGTHAELVVSKGLYHQLYEQQLVIGDE